MIHILGVIFDANNSTIERIHCVNKENKDSFFSFI